MTDCLKTIAENTAKFAGGNVMKSRYYDLIKNVTHEIQKSNTRNPKKSPEEIISNINNKLAQMRGEQNG